MASGLRFALNSMAEFWLRSDPQKHLMFGIIEFQSVKVGKTEKQSVRLCWRLACKGGDFSSEKPDLFTFM